MASNDDELVEEVRALTDYDEHVMSTGQLMNLVDLGKQQLESYLGTSPIDFYASDRGDSQRALFWFTCIAAKVAGGEIAGINLQLESIRTQNPANIHYDYWFDNFRQTLRAAEGEGDSGNPSAASRVLSRTDRSYGQ